jgi:excisionase family DNA binding protein
MELPQNKAYSPNRVARSLGVSEATIKRWCDKGILSFTKTAGGHRRIPIHVVLEFVKDNSIGMAQPEVLGLPACVGTGSRTLEQACRHYGEALEQGDEARCLQLALDLRLAGHDMAAIGDQVIAPAFHNLGQRWQHGETEVYQERRGGEITRNVLARLRDTLSPPASAAPTAVGATLSGDPYSLPGKLCELVLLELGWQARFLGSGLPVDAVAQAVEDLHPRVLWLSFSSLDGSESLFQDYSHLYEMCLERQFAVVIGGRALTGSIRQRLRYSSYGDNLGHLRGFAQSLYRRK